MFVNYIYNVGQDAVNSTVMLGITMFGVITSIALIVSVIAVLFAIFMLKDALNNYVFLGIVSILITLMWLVMLSNSSMINFPDFYAVVPTITILIVILAIILDIFVFYKTYNLNNRLKLMRNRVASIESEYKTLTAELENIENGLKSISEKLDSAREEIKKQLDNLEFIRRQLW